MKSPMMAVIAGVLAGVLSSWFSLQGVKQSVARLDEAAALRGFDVLIIMNRDPATNECYSSTNLKAAGKMGHKITWNINDSGKNKCLGKGDKLQIRFKDEAKNPLRDPRPDGDKKIESKVKDPGQVEQGTYAYDVWFIAANGTETRLEDPDLDIWP